MIYVLLHSMQGTTSVALHTVSYYHLRAWELPGGRLQFWAVTVWLLFLVAVPWGLYLTAG